MAGPPRRVPRGTLEPAALGCAARQALAAAPLAPGSEETLAELRDPSRRPAAPYDSLPPEVLGFQPAEPATLRRGAFLASLRRAKKGLRQARPDSQRTPPGSFLTMRPTPSGSARLPSSWPVPRYQLLLFLRSA